MKLHCLKNRTKQGYTTFGCMWQKDMCNKTSSFILKNLDGIQVPVQSRITAYWPNGSVKWTAHTAKASLLTDEIEVEIAKDIKASQGIMVCETEKEIVITAGTSCLEISKNSSNLFTEFKANGKTILQNAKAVLVLQQLVSSGTKDKSYVSKISSYKIEQQGNLQVIVKYEGVHSADNEDKLPFVIRLKLGLDSDRLDFVHTFLYDGDEEKDMLKGIGVSVDAPLKGELYNRHVKFEGDNGGFHEVMAHLVSWIPRVPEYVNKAQLNGEKLSLQGNDAETVGKVMQAMPFWSEYDLCQQSSTNFNVRKKIIDDNCCYLDCLQGVRTQGGACFGSENGSVLLAVRDFWQKHPTGINIKNLVTDTATATVWLWSPSAMPMDFRHYANRGYNQVYYEGFDFKGATPYGIANTSEFSISFSDKIIPHDIELAEFSKSVNLPAQYVGKPEYYHEMKAFGYWSLPSLETETEKWVEQQLKIAVDFYKTEIEQRQWYGMFNYGDFMHTYDKNRHQWRYDMGGYAWDNTELVPTLWLWYMFLRTGDEDIFTLSEKLSRHASEVDVYHIGKFKGLGSRHNVRHWGCPCKEARIAMAAHHRFYYYLTGDCRMEDIFDELKDNEQTFFNKDPLELFYNKEDMVYPAHARSGPDWSSLCANWLTQWERFNDDKYLKKMQVGIEDIKKAPLQLVSGPDFEFDPKTVHLRYIGERAAGGTHLQICMGAPSVWLEMADLTGDTQWRKMLSDYGRFYYLDRETQLKESGGIIGEREFTLPFMAAAMGAFAAFDRKDLDLARTTWAILLNAMLKEGECAGFGIDIVENAGNQAKLQEIPWISTNFVAQWCLNIIMSLDFIKESLPKTMAEAYELVKQAPKDGFRKA